MRNFITVCLVLFCSGVKAQQKYDVALIPKELLSHAGAVVRLSEVAYEVKSAGQSDRHIKKVITILNQSGDDAAEIVIWYDKITTVRAIKGMIYNGDGGLVSKFSEKNFNNYYANDGFSLFTDDKVKVYRPGAMSYPYTIEYEFDTRSDQTLEFNEWMPAWDAGTAIESSVYTFTCLPDFNINYKEVNLPSGVIQTTDKKGLKTYKWEVKNFKAAKPEPFSPAGKRFLPIVKIAPVNFKYQTISGSFNNWNEMGKWVYDRLLNGRDQLDQTTIDHIKGLTSNISNPKDKAKKIYEYMQQKTRYISVQVGIGGLRPFPAIDVDRLSYGDCKALVNYTQALLKVVDIPSYYCLVQAGNQKISFDTDFASMDQGNHIILCIPFKNDTTFAECTSKEKPFGFLGDFTDDRTVLACTSEGGKLMRTPVYSAGQNRQQREATLTLSADGGISGEMQTFYRGTQYDNREDVISETPADRVKEYKKIYPINNLDIKKLELNQNKSLQPVTDEKISFSAYDFASVVDAKLQFMPNIVNRLQAPVREVRNRKNPVYINRGYTDVDEITYNIPEGYKAEKQPLMVVAEKPFGKFTASVVVNGNKLVYKRTIQMIQGTYTADTYPQLVEFYQQVFDADHYNVILSKQ